MTRRAGVTRNRYKYIRLLSIALITIAPHVVHDVFAQQSSNTSKGECTTTPFSLSKIQQHLVKKDLDEKQLISQIQLYKVDFALETAFDELLNAGASNYVREAIERNPFRPLYFTFPNDGGAVSSYFRVEGCSKAFPYQHLWLFVHRDGEIDGVPQHNEVKLDQNGKWQHNVSLPENGSHKFEIKAVWVDRKSHQDLLSHVKLHCRKPNDERSDKCPGIRVPDSDMTAVVIVMRSRYADPQRSPR